MTLPTVAILGRPNVGKSTLFNRLVGKKLALVDDRPGVTRDRREGDAKLADLNFTVIDTAGLEEAAEGSLTARMREQTEAGIAAADCVLFMIDARAGVTPDDRFFAELVRRSDTPVIIGANKAEGKAASAGIIDAYELGFGDPIGISAEHGDGMSDLYDVLQPMVDAADEKRAPCAPDSPWAIERLAGWVSGCRLNAFSRLRRAGHARARRADAAIPPSCVPGAIRARCDNVSQPESGLSCVRSLSMPFLNGG